MFAQWIAIQNLKISAEVATYVLAEDDDPANAVVAGDICQVSVTVSAVGYADETIDVFLKVVVGSALELPETAAFSLQRQWGIENRRVPCGRYDQPSRYP